MSTESQVAAVSKVAYWAGWVLSVLPALMLTMSGVMKFAAPPDAVEGFKHLGWDINLAVALAVIELGSTLLYLIPRTAVLGAILLTGYLGGAIATHVRIGENSAIVIPVLLGVMIWLGLYLRDVRLRALVPLRS
jgi:hypothetical protein